MKSSERFKNPTYIFKFCYFLLSNKEITGKILQILKKNTTNYVWEKWEKKGSNFFSILHDKNKGEILKPSCFYLLDRSRLFLEGGKKDSRQVAGHAWIHLDMAFQDVG